MATALAFAATTPGIRRVLVVSHRLPLDVQPDRDVGAAATSATEVDDTGAWSISTTEGSHLALHFGFSSPKGVDALWIGWPGVTVPLAQQGELRERLRLERRCAPVFLESAVAQGHYHVYCKNVLWPLFHYVMETEGPHESVVDASAWDVYRAANEAFAAEVLRQYEPGDLVWINDYHLMLVPGILRAALPNATIGFYLHAPFPSSEIFRCLPVRESLLLGVAGANLIGFQNYSYARHFLSTCQRCITCDVFPNAVQIGNRMVAVGVFPVGININLLDRRRTHPLVLAKVAYLQSLYAGKKIIVGRDKMDYIRGVPHKLLAFERLLRDYPEWRDAVVLVQIALPTAPLPGTDERAGGTGGGGSSSFAIGRSAVADQRRLELQVAEIVARINSQYGSLSFTPVQIIHTVEWTEMYALLSMADLCLVTSIRDGMNLTSHEFVACQQERMSPIILSEFAGTAGCFSSAIQVNPWNYQEVAQAINDALTMAEDDKRAKHKPLINYIRKHTAEFWCASFLDELRGRAQQRLQSAALALEKHTVFTAYRASAERLFLLDYDAAVASPSLLDTLNRLGADPANRVFIVSGRDQLFLDTIVGARCPKVGLSAEHGTYLKDPWQSLEWIDLSEDSDASWKNDLLPVLDEFTERVPGSFVEHKRNGLTWHYRMADPHHAAMVAQECFVALETAIGERLPVEILVGKKNLEVRPRATNKGVIVKRLLDRFPAAEFVFCAGDDRTDEDMFRMLRRLDTDADEAATAAQSFGYVRGPRRVVVTCAVGVRRQTDAMFALDAPEDVVALLGDLCAL